MVILKKYFVFVILFALVALQAKSCIDSGGADFYGLDYSPDGFLTINKGAIYRVKEDGSELTQITFPPPGFYDAHPFYSHDGKKMAFNRGDGTLPIKNQIFVLSEGREIQLTNDKFSNTNPAFSVDDKRIYFIRTDFTARPDVPVSQHSIALDGTDLRQENLPKPWVEPPVPPNCRPPFYSPDGRLRVVDGFIEGIATGKKIKIPETGRQRPHRFIFTPDSKRIFFLTGNSYEANKLWSVNADGSSLTDLSPALNKALERMKSK